MVEGCHCRLVSTQPAGGLRRLVATCLKGVRVRLRVRGIDSSCKPFGCCRLAEARAPGPNHYRAGVVRSERAFRDVMHEVRFDHLRRDTPRELKRAHDPLLSIVFDCCDYWRRLRRWRFDMLVRMALTSSSSGSADTAEGAGVALTILRPSSHSAVALASA